MNWEIILYRTIRSFHTFVRRMAAMAMLAGFCTAVVHATPTIVEVRTAAPNVIVAVVQTDVTYERGTNSVPDYVDTAAGPGHWQVNGTSPTVHRYSIPWDELRRIWDNSANNGAMPVITRHRIYLQLSSPLQEGHAYSITHPTYGSTNWTFSSTTSFCESIKVNQVGYSKLNTSRFANFGVYMGDGHSMQFNPLPTYKVYNETTGAILTNGTAVYMGNDTAITNSGNSGEYVYRLSLNAVPEGGPYYVSVDGAGRSRSFGIGDTYSSNIAYVTLRGIYLHRCGTNLTQPYTAFTHAICHTNIYDVRSAPNDDDVYVPPGSTPMFIQGGYHDAGDMDQSSAHHLISILMLSFYEAFSNRFVDNQYNIPESGNGIPDFLDEIMWGVKVWEYLQITNTQATNYGGVRAGWAPNNYTQYGYNDAANDVLNYGTYDVQVDCTGMVAGIFAHASRLIRPYDAAHADALLNRAQWAWAWLANNGHTSEARTSVMYAALQLYLATGNSTYHNTFQSAANSVIMTGNGRDWYDCGNSWYYCQIAHFVSYLLPNVPNPNTTLVQNLKNKILSCAETETYMGPPPENQPYPQGVTKAMGLGADTAQARYADVWMYGCLFTNDPGTLQRYTNAVAQYADFSLGLNPMNMSYYTGLGTDQPNSITDCNSYYTKYGVYDGVPLPDGTHDYHTNAAGLPIGNVPGILVYGPSDGRSGMDYEMAISQKLWPGWDSLPPQRHYAHGHTLEINNEFTVHETMAWNVLMYAFLYTPPGGGPPPPSHSTTAQRASGTVTIDGNLSEAGWVITNAVTNTIIGTPNNTVTFGALWDDTYLYVGAKVLDGNLYSDSAPYPWLDDAIEIYIDGDHNHGHSYDSHDRQIVKGWNTTSLWVNGNQTSGILHAWAPITGGYSVEVAVPWTNFGITPSADMLIGFDVGNDDDDNGGDRESQLMWAGNNNNWTDTSAFGDLKLLAANCTPPPSGMVGWWRAEGNANDAANSNNGTIAGTGTVGYGPGVVGQALVFDGTHRDRVNLGNPTDLQLQDFTIEAWVKRSDPTVTSLDILGADGSESGDGAVILGYGRGGYGFGLANDGRMFISRIDLDGLFSDPLVTDTSWHHIAVTKSGSNAAFYLDGVPQATGAYDHPAPYTFDDGTCACTAAIAIGSRGDARGGTFFGAIDEVSIYNRPLSAAEIQAVYNAGSAGKCVDEFTSDTNTIALYHFNGDYFDSSANGLNLTTAGNVTRFSNPGWMQSPSGQAARFSNLGDQLVISTVPDSVVEPGPSQMPLTIEARIYPRGYKAWNQANATIVGLWEDWDSQFLLYDPKYPDAGQPIGPVVVCDTTHEIVTASQWQNAVSTNTWHKFKLTFAADGTAKCYVDDNLLNTITTSVNVGRSSAWTITLGNFDGDIDEVRISNIVR